MYDVRAALSSDARRFGPGAIPIVDFLLHQFGAAVKKTAVKSLDRNGRWITPLRG
jgi:hypothetical protein